MSNLRLFQRRLASGDLALRPSPFLDSTPPAMPVRWERVEGMLLGLAIGDALGNTSESMAPADRALRYGEITDYQPNRHAEGRRVGLPSDDTQLAAWTLEVLVERGRLDLDALTDIFAARPIFGIGRTVRGFVEASHRQLPLWDRAPASAGNGALMRIAPVLLPHLHRPGPALWADAALAASLTHDDAASTSACVAFVAMLLELLQLDAPPPQQWWVERYVELARELEGDVTLKTRFGAPWQGPLWRFVQVHVPEAMARDLPAVDACNTWGSGAFLLETVPSALYILARHGHDPEAAIIRAVNDTRDNDTVAAIVGAAVGALHGVDRLPARWRQGLLGRTAADDDGRLFELLEMARRRFGTPRAGAVPRPERRRIPPSVAPGLTPDRLLATAGSPALALLTALAFRGFLIETDGIDFWLSDNACGLDAKSMERACLDLGVAVSGVRKKRRFRLADLEAQLVNRDIPALLQTALDLWQRCGSEWCTFGAGWPRDKQRRQGFKLDAGELDRDVAMFVKGLSAAGVITNYSCSGHEQGAARRRGLHIDLASEFDAVWVDALFRLLGVATSSPLDHVREDGQIRVRGPRCTDRQGLDHVRRIGATLYAHRRAAHALRLSLLAEIPDELSTEDALDRFRAACAAVTHLPATPPVDAGLFAPWLLGPLPLTAQG